MVEVGIRF